MSQPRDSASPSLEGTSFGRSVSSILRFQRLRQRTPLRTAVSSFIRCLRPPNWATGGVGGLGAGAIGTTEQWPDRCGPNQSTQLSFTRKMYCWSRLVRVDRPYARARRAVPIPCRGSPTRKSIAILIFDMATTPLGIQSHPLHDKPRVFYSKSPKRCSTRGGPCKYDEGKALHAPG